MNLLKKTVVALAILSFLSLQFPMSCLTWENPIYKKAYTSESITKHTPEFVASPEQKIPVEPIKPAEKVEKRKMNKWLWVGLGALAAGVLAGAGGGGGGEDGNSGPATGDITVQWND